jgi:hypothetical protein
MSADHNRLDALRRLAKDRAATPAEKATARRLARALAAKIGNRPRHSRRKASGAALPEPPAARWRRFWVLWLEAALQKIEVAGSWVHVIWIASLIGLVLMFVFGTEAVRRQAGEVLVVRTFGLLAVVLLVVPITCFLKLLAWWLKTWRDERLRPALVFLSRHVLWLGMAAGAIATNVYLENHLKWPMLLAYAAAMVAMYAICIPWWLWAYPAIERTILRSSRGRLRAGVAMFAVALTVLATGGVWAYVTPRVVPTPPEFEVPAPAVVDAYVTMLRYKIAALDCSIARINIERDVMRQPECAILPETRSTRRNKSEPRLRDDARQDRCQRLMVDLELATPCGRPDIAALADRLRAEIRAEAAPSRHKQNRGGTRRSTAR